MKTIKKIILASLIVLVITPVYGVSKLIPLDKHYLIPPPPQNLEPAFKALFRNQFNESIKKLKEATAGTAEEKYMISYISALTNYNKGILYSEVSKLSQRVAKKYLDLIITTDKEQKVNLANFFRAMGQILLFTKGSMFKSLEILAALKKTIGKSNDLQRYYAYATIYEGYIYGLLGEKKKTYSLWAKSWQTYIRHLKPGSIQYAEIVSEMLIAGIRLNITPPSIDSSGAFIKKINLEKSFEIHIAKNIAWLFCYHKKIAHAEKILEQATFNGSFFSEHPATNKELRYYHPHLFKDLASIYFKITTYHAQSISIGSHLPAVIKNQANFILGEIAFLTGNPNLSTYYLKKIPPASGYYSLANIYTGLSTYRDKGKTQQALMNLKNLYFELSADPKNELNYERVFLMRKLMNYNLQDLLAKNFLNDFAAGNPIDKSKIALQYEIASIFSLNKKPRQAMRVYDQVINKEYPHNIRYNHPCLLVAQASNLIGNNKLSHALNIFFEMGSHFSEFKHLQNYIQGIYSHQEKGGSEVSIQ